MPYPESATVGGVYVVGRHGGMGARSWNTDYGIAPACTPPPIMGSPSNFHKESLQDPLGQYMGYLGTRVNRSIGPIREWIWIEDHNI